jgi:outer membrane protein TolC
MRRWGAVLIVLGMLMATVPLAAASDESRPGADLRLLDEAPNLAEVLNHQWSDDLPADVANGETASDRFGLLLGTSGTPITTLSECIGLALKNNTDLQIQRLGPLAATNQVRRARGVFDPKLFADVLRDRLVTPATTVLTSGTSPDLFSQNFSLNAGLRKQLLSGGQVEVKWSNTRYVANPSIANTLVPRYNSSLGMTLVQPLLRDFGWRYSTLLVQIAQNTEEASYHQYEAAIATMVAQVERSYWILVLAIENVEVQEQGLTLSRELLRQNEGKYNVGALPRTAVLEAQSVVARREANLIRFRNLSSIARDNLRAIVNGRNSDLSNLLTIDPQDKPSATPLKADLGGSLDTALRQRPEIKAARLDVHGRGLQRRAAENQLLPRLNLVGGAGVNGLAGSRPDINGFSGQPAGPLAGTFVDGGYSRALDLLTDGRFYNYSVGATIEIPLSNAQARADYSKTNIDLEQSKLTLQKVQETVTLEVSTAVGNIEADLKSVDATKIARELAEENVRNQQARYDVGLATTKDLLDFQDKLTQARFAEVEALTRYNSDIAELHRVEGTLLSARNVIVDRGRPEDTPWYAWF